MDGVVLFTDRPARRGFGRSVADAGTGDEPGPHGLTPASIADQTPPFGSLPLAQGRLLKPCPTHPIMKRAAKSGSFWRTVRLCLGLLLCVLLPALLWAQEQPAEAPHSQGAAAAHAEPANSQAQQGAPASGKISAEEAQELFRSVDEILKFASERTGLPIHESVKRQLVNRDQVADYIGKHMEEDEDSQRLERGQLVLKKLGLLPKEFDLKTYLVGLLREQVAGYYDPRTKTVNLLDWVDPEEQKPVLAHELTHALQDQNFDLEKWMKAGDVDLAKEKRQPTTADIAKDEEIAVRQALVEGQAMVVLLEYTLAPTGQSVTNSPQIVEAVKQGMLVGTADSVLFRESPLFLKETLTFPYRYGLDFVVDLLSKQGKDKAYGGVLRNPPATTRQIMEPDKYLSGERIEPLTAPDFGRIFRNYELFDAGAFGEFDVAVFIDQFAGADRAHELYPRWRGGYYYAARAKNDASASLGLMYVSRWSSAERAAQFAAIYAQSLAKRYKRTREPLGDPAKSVGALETLQTLTGTHTWLTEDGPVVIEVEGDTVLAVESFDPATAEDAQKAVFAKSEVGSRK
jgi:hypothetical protein